jgi:acyl-coenzyme A thioesterase PaaI-like protein
LDDQRVNTINDHGCFGCGERNPIGLKLVFYRTGDRVRAEFVPERNYEGYLQMTHGGIVATVLDEAMSWAVIDAGNRLAVTGRMTIQFRKPVPSGQGLVVEGWITRDRRRAVETAAELRDAEGEVLVTASALFVRVSDEQQREWEATYVGSLSK